MKIRARVSAFLLSISIFLSAGVAATAVNIGFENGDLSGWNVSGWGGAYFDENWNQVDYTFLPETNPYVSHVPAVSGSAAMEGSRGLAMCLGQGEHGWFTGPDDESYWFDGVYYGVSVSRNFWLNAGDTLQGWARFGSEDGNPSQADFAGVSIDNTHLWGYDCSVFPSFSYGYRWLSWEEWSFTAPADGSYELAFTIYGDDQFNSAAHFDVSVPVPDSGSSLLLLTVAVCSVVGLRHRLRG